MTRHLEREIDRLKESILSVGTLVEESLNKSVRAFKDRDKELAGNVIEGDAVIDQMEVEVEEECLKILALHQPVAIDLRYIISVLKINNDLERIADLAVNIAKRSNSMANRPPVDVPDSIPRIASMVQEMLRKSLEALVRMDVSLAREVLKSDDEVDDLHSGMYPTVQSMIEGDPVHMAEYIQLLGISRYLERAADHSTNIAEDVIYMVEGEIHRHVEPNSG